MSYKPSMEEIALAWAIRTSDPEFRDWEAFMAWLDGDPLRNLAYDRAAALIADAASQPWTTHADVFPLSHHALDPVASTWVSRSTPKRWFLVGAGAALAASVAGVLTIGRSAEPSNWRVIETAAGQARSIQQGDGSRIDLAGATRLRFDPAKPRLAVVDRGRALFTVRHDGKAPYQVVAGEHRLVDLGTTFEVSHEAGETRVAVAEGLVSVDPDAGDLRLAPGQAVNLLTGRRARVEAIAPDSVGQWRRDRMSYVDAPLSRVAADLSVAFGHAVTVDARAGAQRFNGTVIPATLRGRPDAAAALLGVRIVTGPRGWELRGR